MPEPDVYRSPYADAWRRAAEQHLALQLSSDRRKMLAVTEVRGNTITLGWVDAPPPGEAPKTYGAPGGPPIPWWYRRPLVRRVFLKLGRRLGA